MGAEISSPRSLEWILKSRATSVQPHRTFKIASRWENSGSTFVANGTNRSEGLLLLNTPNRIYVYRSSQHEFSSPKNKDDGSSDGIISNTRKTPTPYLMKGHEETFINSNAERLCNDIGQWFSSLRVWSSLSASPGGQIPRPPAAETPVEQDWGRGLGICILKECP